MKLSMKTRLIITAFILSVLVSYSSNVKFYDINTIHGISMREIASVCKDKNGFIWASSKAGVLRLTDNSYHIYPLPYETPNIIYTKLIYEKDSLLAFTNNGQIF